MEFDDGIGDANISLVITDVIQHRRSTLRVKVFNFEIKVITFSYPKIKFGLSAKKVSLLPAKIM